MMQRLASQRDDIDLTVFVGDLNEGVEIAKRNIQSNYDVIISRGGTAEMIGNISSIPLVEISLSVYDILRSIKLAENYSGQYAIVGYPGITDSAQLLCDLLQYKIDIFTVHTVDEVETTLKKLKKHNYQMILCDMIAKTTAKRYGLNAILITSGDESIESAFDQAVKLYKSYVAIKEDNHFLEDIIKSGERNILVYDSKKQLAYSSGTLIHGERITALLKKEIDDCLIQGARKFIKNIDTTQYTILGKKIRNHSTDYVVYFIKEDSTPLSRSKLGVSYSSKSEVENYFFNSFYSIINRSDDLNNRLKQMSASRAPILIFGESGNGKSQVARQIYTESPLVNNPFITIECTLVSDKTWHYLLNHHDSPLLDNENTLFFKDLHTLSESKLKNLVGTLIDTNAHRQNQIIFSYSVDTANASSPEILATVNALSCLTISLAPLREHTDEIPKLSSLYLSTLNLNLAKQIIGFEPEALSLLQDYSWPFNYTQFKRILEEMVIVTTTPYISASTVRTVLSKEKSITHAKQTLNPSETTIPYEINTKLTLNEINQEIIALYVEKSNGNLSAAAKNLGVSRTTLWRYLK
jgi:transcriptional regulator with PAS, ATPase and Fis domain